jgi:hypothetical protein
VIQIDSLPKRHSSSEMVDIATEKAAIRIQRCWRLHSSLITTIDSEILIKMPHHLFKRFVAVIMYKHQQSTIAKNLRHIIARRTYERIDAGVPIIIANKRLYGAAFRLPIYLFPDELPEAIIESSTIDSGQFALTSRVQLNMADYPKRGIDSKKELDAIVRLLASIDLIAWDIQTGNCYARANLSLQILSIMGISERCIFKEYALIPCVSFVSPDQWINYFHVAVMIVLGDKTQWIIDPALNGVEALTITNWYQRLTSAVRISDHIVERVNVNLSDQQCVLKAININYESLKPYTLKFEQPTQLDALVKVPRDYNLITTYPRYEFVRGAPTSARTFFQKLAENRSHVETSWLRK